MCPQYYALHLQIYPFHLNLSLVAWGVICMFRDTGICHYFGYFLAVLPDFWVPFWAIPRFVGIIFSGKI